MYAKIDHETGRLIFPPTMLENVPLTFPAEEPDGEPITGLYNVGYDPNVEPRPEVVAYLLDLGYMPVTEAERPEDGEGYHYIDGYELDGNTIRQVWERVEDDPPEPTLEDGLRILLGGE